MTSEITRAGHDALTEVDALAQMAFLVQGIVERLAGEHDVSLVQTRLLGILRDRRPTMTELAALLGLDKSSTTGLVDRAERRGLVERTPSPTDGRAFQVRLTRSGRAIVATVGRAFGAEIDSALRPLTTTERATLTRLANKLLAAHASARGVNLFP